MRRIPARDAERIRAKVAAYAAGDPADARPLMGRAGFRLRVGQWRVIFDDDGAMVAVLRVGPRGDVYKGT